MMNEDQQFCLRWNNFQSNVLCAFQELKDEENFVDVTISCEGKQLRAHKMVLSACSSYFKELLKDNPCSHPIIIMNNIPFSYMEKLLTFIYSGQVNVTQKQLTSFLLTAETLKIKGLADPNSKDAKEDSLPKSDNKSLGKATHSSKHTLREEGPLLVQHSDNHVLSPAASNNSELLSEDSNVEVPFKRIRASTPVMGHRENEVLLKPKLEVEDKEEDSNEEEKYVPELSMNENFGDYLKVDYHSETNKSELSSSTSKGNQDMLPISDAIETPFNMRPHSLDPQPCPICHRMYSNLSNLRQHMRIIHAPRMCVCPLCLKPFKTELYLRRHLVSYHDVSKAHVSSYSCTPTSDAAAGTSTSSNSQLSRSVTGVADSTECGNTPNDDNNARLSGGCTQIVSNTSASDISPGDSNYEYNWLKHAPSTFDRSTIDSLLKTQADNGS